MATIRIPTPLRPFTASKEEVTVGGAKVSEVVANLAAAYPDLSARITGPDGAIRRFVNLYVNDADVRTLDGQDTVVADSDTLSIVPAIAGGDL